MYRYARAGEDVPRTPRAIVVHALDLVEWTGSDAVVAVSCSKGTYVRVLAEDIGAALGCGAHLAGLRRTATGGFRLDDAVSLERIEAMSEADRLGLLRPAAVLVAEMARLAVGESEGRRFGQGQALPAPGSPDGEYAVFLGDRLLGVADVSDGLAKPRRVVAAGLPAEPREA